ncbi:hypothetical protein GQ53DRAFT_889701 [Thozetella sp. PMI_491]|nr:hypothetical protein GQ53DRAFT_889701 [Thozetella sp. PMI_491]
MESRYKQIWKYAVLTFWVVYGLNIVAWGGMLFLLLVNAAPAMCYPTCDDINSPRRVWVEIDAQILTGLFCVTAFGFAPWRIRDLYYLLEYRLLGRVHRLQALADIHGSWTRLPKSQKFPLLADGSLADASSELVQVQPSKLEGASPTKLWKLDLVVWLIVSNTLFQVALCGTMWGMDRFSRPSWVTGFLVAGGCLVAMFGGLIMWLEGRRVKKEEKAGSEP